MKQKLSLWMTLMLTIICTGIIGFVGIYAMNKQMPMWFGVYVSSGVDTRVEIAVDNYEFTPIFDNVNKNFTSTLTDKGMYRVGDKVFLPLTNLSNSSVVRLKIYNYSKTEALNAEVIDGNASIMDSTYSVSSSYMENLRPMPATATLAADTVPYDIVNFQVNCLYKNTQVNLTLKLNNSPASNINTIAQTYEIEGNQTLPSYNVGRYVDYYYNSQIADINTTGGNNFGIDSGFSYATTDADGDAVTPTQKYKYFVQVGEYPQTVVTYDSALDLITPLGSNYTTTTASTLDLDNDGVAEIMPIGTTFVCEKTYQQYMWNGATGTRNAVFDVNSMSNIYWYKITINEITYKFVNTVQRYYDNYSLTNGVTVDSGTVNGSNAWFYVEPINWVIIGGYVDNTEVKGYDQNFKFDSKNGFYYNSPETPIKNLILNSEITLDSVCYQTATSQSSTFANWGEAVLQDSTHKEQSYAKTFLNTNNSGFAYGSGLYSLFADNEQKIIPQEIKYYWFNNYRLSENGEYTYTTDLDNNYINIFSGILVEHLNSSYKINNYFLTYNASKSPCDYSLAHSNVTYVGSVNSANISNHANLLSVYRLNNVTPNYSHFTGFFNNDAKTYASWAEGNYVYSPFMAITPIIVFQTRA